MEMEIISGFPDVEERLSVLFDTRFHPVSWDIIRKSVKITVMGLEERRKFGDCHLSLAPLHHPGTSHAFKLEGPSCSFAYATDTDFQPLTPEGEKLLKGVDWSVLDSQFLVGDAIEKAHYGHASYKHAIDVAARLGIQNCFLYHYDPNYSDDDLKKLESQSSAYAKESYGTKGPLVQMATEGHKQDVVF